MIEESGLPRRIAELRRVLAGRETAVISQNIGATQSQDGLHLLVWDRSVMVTLPGFVGQDAESGQELDIMTQALLAYYLTTSDGVPPANEWIAFTELPNGRFYTNAFQSYTGNKLARVFGDDVGWFGKTAVSLNGQAVSFADAAFRFQILPHVPVLIACWQGDEDFTSSYKLLFDAHTGHHLPTDACAIIGSIMTGKLIKAAKKETI